MVQKNRFPSRSKLYLYSTVEEAKILDREKSLWCKTLNGPWKFNWVIKPTDAPDDFYKEDYDVSEWDDIEVYLRRNNAIGTPNTRGRQGFDSWIRTKDKVA